MRRPWIIMANLAVPGAGLIALRREWLGTALAFLFGVLAQIGLLGLLLIPLTVPRWLALGGLGGAVAVWAWAQWLLHGRLRCACGEEVAGELARLSQHSAEAVAAHNLAEAYDLLRAALIINDEDVSVNRQWADLLTLMDRPKEAAAAWRRVLRLETDPDGRGRAQRALANLTDRATTRQTGDKVPST